MRRLPLGRSAPARGVTLIEVVAALALVAGTVTALLLAHGRSIRQATFADERERVAADVEELIIGWTLHDVDVRAPANGTFAAMPDWTWQRRATLYYDSHEVKLLKVQLIATRTASEGAASRAHIVEWLVEADKP